MEDEIDLREYVEVLIKWWREILLLSVLAAVVAGGAVLALELLRTPLYEASATVAMVRVKSDITFDERYRTLSEEDLQALSGATRRSALVGLVLSSSVAEAVLEEVGARLDVAERNPAVLLRMVDAAILTPENGRGESDLIRITVTSADPEQAATIANAWARHYVQQVNDLYGSVPAELMVSVQKDLEQAQAAYDAAQGQLEVFMAENGTDRLQRLITEKEAIIESLQAGKQMAVQSLINEELTARQEIVAAYIDALAKNRLLAFQKEQEAKQQIVGKYIDSEVKSRLVAIERDRHAREEIYNRLADAELQSVMSVFDEQLQDHLSQLSQRYAEKQRLERLLANARNLQAQVVEGGDAAAQTNGVALLLLKTQVVSSQVSSSQVVSSTTSFEPLPVNLHLNIDTIPGSELTAAQQQADLAALVEVLDNRIDELSSEIQAQSERLLAGDTYLLLDRIDPGQLAVASAVTSGGGVQAETESSVGSLKTAILQRYQDLYKVGGLAEQGQQLALESELFEEIRTLYPELFQLDELSQLGEAAPGESPLALLGEEEAKQLLQLQGLDELASYGAADEAVSQAIDRMEMELQNLRAQHEAQKAQEQQLTQQRDLAWSTFLTLSNKNAELSLSNTAANSEVRFAAPAIPALEPVEGPNLVMVVALATVVGLMLAIFIAFFANFMGADPFLASRRRAAIQG